MFVLIWVALLFCVRGNNSDKATLLLEKSCQITSYCIDLIKGEITAEAGLCVVIPCSFSTAAEFTVTNLIWYKCDSAPQKKCDKSDKSIFNSSSNKNIQSEFKGRVSLLEPDLSLKNCSIIINDLNMSDSGSYQLRLVGYRNGKTDGFTFKSKANITVTDLSQKPTVMIPPLTAGQQTTLTCTAPALCSGSVPKITWTWRRAGKTNSQITGNITAFKTENLTAVTQRHSSTLTLNISAKHHGTKVTCKVSFRDNKTAEETVTLNVTYVKQLNISGNTTVKKGGTLNLTCSVDSFPASFIIWTKSGCNDSLHEKSENEPLTQGGSASLIIHNMTADNSGQYICTAKHQNKTLTAHSEVTVTFPPKILNGSRCMNQSEILTCVCISQGFPLPTITWPLLKNHTEYSVFTTVSNHTVNSSITLPLTTHSRTTIECVSRNEDAETKETLTMRNDLKQDGTGSYTVTNFLLNIKWPQVIVAFCIGILLSATIACLSRKCHRKQHKNSGNLAENMEMTSTQAILLADAGQKVEDDMTHYQEAAERAAEAAGQSTPDDDVEPKEVEYSDIDFFMLKRENPTEAKETQETTETEYAEIKKEATVERQDNEGEMLEGNEEEEVIVFEHRETEQCILANEEESEDVPLYSNVNKIKHQI